MREGLGKDQATPDGALGPTVSRAVTPRAFIIGGFLCVIIAIGVPYGSMIIQGTRMGLSSCTPAAFFLLFLWLAIPQILLGVIHRRWMLNQSELITIYIMMLVATAIPTRGFTGMLLPMITGSYYYATPENNWAGEIHPYLPDWMVVKDLEGIKAFYEGFLYEETIPWDIWIWPMLRWLVFMGSFYLVILCMMSILRRQWVDHERLIYPLTQTPLAMIRGDDSIIKAFFKHPLVWVGFALPFLFNTVNALHHYHHFIPSFGTGSTVQLFRHSVSLRVRVNFLMFGFAYFINAGVAFSLWFFYLIRITQQGIFSIVGIRNSEELGPWTDSGDVLSIFGHQMTGAILVFVAFGLWMARSHLSRVIASPWEKSMDDDGEILSYRAALLGMMVGLLVMGFWLHKSGLPFWAASAALLFAFVTFIALSRVIAEAGLPTITPAMVPAGFVVSGFGSSALGQTGMIALGYTFVWAGDHLVFMMAPVANALKLSGEASGRRRGLFWAMAIGVAISLVISLAFMLFLGYTYGALNLHPQYFTGFAQYPSSFAVAKIVTPSNPSVGGWLWTALGGTVMALLMLAQHRLLWWPLHPIGFLVSGGWAMNNVWFSVFLAWLIKTTVLKYGGPRLYRQTRPFFFGVVLGQFVSGGLWLIIDAFTGMTGNVIPVY